MQPVIDIVASRTSVSVGLVVSAFVVALVFAIQDFHDEFSMTFSQGGLVAYLYGISVFDGPFIESKELIGGYVVVSAESLEDAGRWARLYIDTVEGDEVDVRVLPSSRRARAACASRS